MKAQITETTIQQFVAKVSDHQSAMTGAVLVTSAAQAVALGEACVQISLDNQVDRLNWHEVSRRIEKIARTKENLLHWLDEEMKAIAEHASYLEGNQLFNQQRLCESCVEVSRACITVIKLLAEFRGSAFNRVVDDLEMTINLLIDLADTATALLDKKLQNTLYKNLIEEYQAVRDELKQELRLFRF
ncbi:hypothetical protein QUF64_14910 [Anaerolineales bacterium HSG6]|nr:hypothetical protein [Anaerolineales bacterium HSG6]MDM8530136.1 hypothetical protein [Anaerolineales bacterium HSG25]